MAGYYDEETGEFIDTGDVGVNQSELDDTSGTAEIGDYYDMAEFDAATEAYLKANYPELAADATLATKASAALQKLGAGTFDALKKTFTNKDGSTDWRAVAGAAGGLYGLYQSNKPQEKAGYQGGIPKYEAVRKQIDYSRDTARRPGEAGRQFFTAPQFVKQGDADALAAAQAAATKQATDIQNQAFYDQRFLKNFPATTTSTPVTSPAGGGTAVATRPASSVAQDLKVPVYTAENARGVQMASGGLAGMAQGRYLGGATDGMADKIPARIGDKQEARLSHGEFVIPADVVSHLGNGNSEAGAKRLYDMMDKIRTARTGTKKQGKKINPDKFLA
jgi:hypothetical protein